MRTRWIVAAAGAAALVLGGCSSGPEKDKSPRSTPASPTFDVPSGVTLTPGGTRLDEDEAATVVHRVGDRAASAVTVTVTRVRKGSIKDFRFFSLDATTKRSTPFYVEVEVENEGPAGLGGAALPIFVHDDSDTDLPASDIVGSFKPCPRSTLPKSFLAGSSAKLCLVFLVPKGRSLVSVDLRTGSAAEAVSWRV